MSIETHVKGILFLSFFMANCCLSAAIPIQTEDLGIHSFSTYNNTSRSIVKYEKTKVERLLQYNKDSACLYIENLLRRASFLYDTVLLTEAFYLKGIAFYMDASFDTAAVFFSKSAQLASCKRCPDQRAAIYSKTSENLFLTDQSEEATEYLGKAWEISERNNDYETRVRILITLARQLDRLGLSNQYLSFIRLLRMNYLPWVKDSLLRVQICQLNAVQLSRAGKHKLARACASEVFKSMAKNSSSYLSLNVGRTLSLLCYYEGDKVKAYNVLKEAGEMAMNDKFLLEASYIYNLAAHFLQQDGEPQQALIYQRKVMQLREKVGFRMPLMSAYINYAIALQKAGRPDSIPFYLEKALGLANQCHYLPEQKRASEELAKYYQGRGEFKRGLVYLKNANYFENQIVRRLSNDQKKMLASKIVSRGTEEEIYGLQSKIQANFWLIVLVGFVGGLLIIAFFLAIENRKRESNLHLLEVKRKILIANLSPNFIFNSLVAIKNIIRAGRNEEAARYLSSFARLIRVIMVSPQVDFHSLDKELSVLENYFQLQQIWLEERLTYETQVPEEMLGNRMVIPPFFCHPVIEQIIFLAQSKKDMHIHALISFAHKEKMINQEIRLELKGSMDFFHEIIKQPKLKKTIELTMQRLDILNKGLDHHHKARFSLTSQPGTEISIITIALNFPV
ncbi:MAG: histidine kinase [Bacteroidales bacterium]|jgi:tetratricopeptide (TPR) repeat protein|nr:histidine kinase [Bacteroidales bacterium]NPV35544.1 histidine kinase [Bacteroidales bacterium]